jgi:translation initiation factor 1
MKRKNSGGIVFSTNPDFRYENNNEQEEVTLPPERQQLRIRKESKGRGGKTVTVISGFRGTKSDGGILARELKSFCGVGGSVKEDEIIIQGDMREKIVKYLSSKGFKVK